MVKTQTSPAELAEKEKSKTVIPPQPKEESKKPTVTLATSAKPVSNNVTNMKTLLNNLINVKAGSKVPTKSGDKTITYSERSIKALGKVFDFVWANQEDKEVLNELRKFFVTNRNGYMSGENGLQGMNHISDTVRYNRYSAMWILMYELTNPNRIRTKYDYTHALKYTSNPNCAIPNGFVEYVVQRMA